LSDAGPSATDAGTAEAAPAEATPGGVDLSPITEQLNSLGARLDQFGAQLPQQEAAPTADPFDFSDLFGAEAEPEPEPVAPQVDLQQMVQRLQQATSSQSEQQIQQAIEPLMEIVSNMQADTDAGTLIEAFPQLADPEVAEAVVNTADSMAAAMGLPPQVARSAPFIEQVYKAQLYEQMARGEVPVGDLTNTDLETGGGAMPQQRSEVDIAQQIKSAGSGNSFWGTRSA
jgi:hypothetical protein